MIHRRSLTITLSAPYLTRGNLIGLFGIDAPLARNTDNKLYLPGTLVIGKLAESFRHLNEAGATDYGSDLRQIFAHSEVEPKAGEEPTARDGRRRLFIGDLVCDQVEAQHTATRTRVAIDTLEGNATEGALQVIEEPFKPRTTIAFTGEIRLLATEEDAKAVFERIERALGWITQWGGDRTVGFGVGQGAVIADPAPIITPVLSTMPKRLRLRFAFKDLLCVGDLRTSSNTYLSAAVISGGAIKGAIANQILASHGASGALSDFKYGFEALATHFSKLRISHAFPVKKVGTERPRRIPFSWSVTDQTIQDHALHETPSAALLSGDRVPKFEPDWKDPEWGIVGELAGWDEPATHLRLRTQIDETTRSAKENRLFAIGYRDNMMHDWIADVDFDGEERDKVFAELLTVLGGGLVGVGRGGAFAEVTPSEAPDVTLPSSEGRIIMTLQTPALLRLADANGDVTAAYQAAFDSLSMKAKLSAVFVRERMRGASFMARRLPQGGAEYRPWLLTEAGSVFVFEDIGDISAFSRYLEIPRETLAFYGVSEGPDLWRYCPYLPENGYGEVAFGPLGEVDAANLMPVKGVLL